MSHYFSLVWCLCNLHGRRDCFWFFGICRLEKGSRVRQALL